MTVVGHSLDSLYTFFVDVTKNELCRKSKTLTMSRVSCYCVSQLPHVLPAAQFAAAVSCSEDPNLSKSSEPVPSYMLSCSPENNNFTDPDSIISCVDLLDKLASTVLQTGFFAWFRVNIHDNEVILKALMSGYPGIDTAGVDDPNLALDAPETLCPQNPVPNQPPRINAVKVRSLLH